MPINEAYCEVCGRGFWSGRVADDVLSRDA